MATKKKAKRKPMGRSPRGYQYRRISLEFPLPLCKRLDRASQRLGVAKVQVVVRALEQILNRLEDVQDLDDLA